MKVRIINSQKVWQGDAIPTRIVDRPNVTHYEQRADLHEADGFYDAILMDIPAGSRLVSETWTIVDHKAVQGGVIKTDEVLEHEAQSAKPVKTKNREKQMKALLTAFGFPVPIPQDAIDDIIPTLMAQVESLLADNKDKDAVRLLSNVTAMLALWVTLGDDVFAKYLGDD